MKNLVIIIFGFISINCFSQDSFELFTEKKIEEINKTIQIGRLIPNGYQKVFKSKERKFYLKGIGINENEEIKPLYQTIRIIDNDGEISSEFILESNRTDTLYFIQYSYLIGDNRYIIIKIEYSFPLIIDLVENKAILNYKGKKRENAEVHDAVGVRYGTFFIFDNDYLIYRQNDIGTFGIDFKDDNNPKELETFYVSPPNSSQFLFIDNLGETGFKGIISDGKKENTKYLFKGINLIVENGIIKNRIKNEQFIIFQKTDNENLIIDLKQGKILDNQKDKELIEKIIIN